MAVAMRLSFDTAAVATALEQLGRRGPVAVARGLNRTASSERTAMARAVAADLKIKVSDSRESMWVRKASAKQQTLGAAVVCTGSPRPLIIFRARGPQPSKGRGKGVTYTMQGQRRRIADAFIATVRGANDGEHIGVFRRVGKQFGGGARRSKGAWSPNLPIKQLYGPSIAHVFGKLMNVGLERRNGVLAKNVEHEIQFELSRQSQG